VSQAESPSKVSKSQQVVMTLPPTLGAMVQVVQPALDRLAIGEPGLRLLVLVPDADTAHALAAAVRPAADTPPLLVPVTSPARGVRLLGQAPVALVGSPREIAALLPSGQLKLEGLAQFLLLQADLTLALADAADVEAIAADLPKELPRTLTTTVETEHVAGFIKAYLKRPRRVGEDVVPDDARPLSIQYVPVTAHTRALALRRVLDHANAPSVIVVAEDEEGRDEAAGALRVLGYPATPESHVRAEAATATEHSVLRVLWDVPATRAALENALAHAPTQTVVLCEPRQVAHLRALLAGGSLAQLVPTESLAEAERREAQRTAQVTAVLAGGLSVAELRAVEGLLAEYDAIAIAAAALRLLDQEQATVRALRIGVTTATPKVKAEPAAAPAAAPRVRAARAAEPAPGDAPAGDATATPSGDAGAAPAPMDGTETIEQDEAAAPLPRASRRSEPATTTGVDEWKLVWINVGARDGATPASLVGAITGESGLDRGVIGAIDLRDTHALVEIAADNAEQVVGALTGSVIRGRDVTARIDQVGGRIERPTRGAPRGGRDDRGPRSGGAGRPFQRREEGGFGGGRPSFGRDDRAPRGGGGGRPFQRRDDGDAPRGRPFQRREDGGAGGGRPFQRREEGGFGGGRPFQRDDRGPRGGGGGAPRPFQRRDDGDAPRGRPFQRREEGSGGGRPFQRDDRGPRGGAGGGTGGGYPRRDRDESGAPPRRGFDRRPDDFAERAERLQRSRRPAPGGRRPFTRPDEA
jgi:ATP-dependent RNA helicase DeaD